MERGGAEQHYEREVYAGESYSCPSSTGVRPIDRKHLARYTLGDKSLETEVLGLFLEQLPNTVEQMRSAATDKDWLRAAHTLKGSSRCVGAWRLARMAEQAERMGGIGNRLACLEAVLRIEAAVEEARSFIVDLCNSN